MNTLGVKVAIRHEDWGCLVLSRPVFSIIHAHVGKTSSLAPSKGTLGTSLVVTQLKTSEGFINVEPDNEIKVVREKPATFQVTTNLTDADKFPHSDPIECSLTSESRRRQSGEAVWESHDLPSPGFWARIGSAKTLALDSASKDVG